MGSLALRPQPVCIVYRPLAVRIFSGLLIFTGALALVGAFFALGADADAGRGIAPWRLALSSAVSGALNLVAGLAMQRGAAWGRTLFLAYTPFALALGALVTHHALLWPTLVFGLAYYLVALFFLTRPLVNRYFRGALHEAPPALAALARHRRQQQNPSDTKRALGVLCLVAGGFLLYFILVTIALFFGGAFALPAPVAVFFTLLLFGVPAALLLALGVRLWGPPRWRAALGWVGAATGGLAALYGLMTRLMRPALYEEGLPDALGGNFFGAMTLTSLVGLAVGLAGAALVRLQWKEDRAQVEAPLAASRTADRGPQTADP